LDACSDVDAALDAPPLPLAQWHVLGVFNGAGGSSISLSSSSGHEHDTRVVGRESADRRLCSVQKRTDETSLVPFAGLEAVEAA